jgi:hypothetical protein
MSAEAGGGTGGACGAGGGASDRAGDGDCAWGSGEWGCACYWDGGSGWECEGEVRGGGR